MAQIQAELKRAILDELWNAVPQNSAATLEEIIRKFKSGMWPNIKNGSFVNATSANGNQVSREIPAYVRQLSPDQFFMLGQEFLELQTLAISTLGGTPDDDAVYSEMQSSDSMQTVRRIGGDYTGLRFPTTGPGVI